MAKKQQVDTERATRIKELLAKGVPKKSARRQVDKQLAELDRVEIGKDGTERPADPGEPL